MTHRLSVPDAVPRRGPSGEQLPPPDVIAFIRYCHRRRGATWPELYDEMCHVASRRLFRGWGAGELAEQGIGFSLFETPRLAALVDLVVHVGGQTASYVDLAAAITSTLGLVIVAVISLGFLVLMMAFRSIVIPAQAALANVLSVIAAFGVVTAIFQYGWGLGLVGVETTKGTDPIASFVPLIMFAVLFGLSMDYQVFLMSQIEQHRAGSSSDREAIAAGLAVGGRVIVAAALIMISVFASFILNGDPTVKQFGVGLAVAIAIDATIVRCLLVPSLMILLGRANWWLPRALERALPNLGIEGEDYFRRQEVEAEAG